MTDRPVLTEKIEITQEMIEAGVLALRRGVDVDLEEGDRYTAHDHRIVMQVIEAVFRKAQCSPIEAAPGPPNSQIYILSAGAEAFLLKCAELECLSVHRADWG